MAVPTDSLDAEFPEFSASNWPAGSYSEMGLLRYRLGIAFSTIRNLRRTNERLRTDNILLRATIIHLGQRHAP